MKPTSALTGLIALIMLSACDEGSGVTPGFVKGPIAKSTIQFARSQGAILTQIHGKVLGLQDAALREKVLPLIAGSLGRKLFKFTMQAGSAGVGDVSFRIAFGYPKGEQNDRLCTDKIPELAPEEKDITAIGALCNDGELLAEASGGLLLRR